MKNQTLSQEFLYMQKLAGIITESEYVELTSINELSFSSISSGIKNFFSKFKITPEVENLIYQAAVKRAQTMTPDQIEAFENEFDSEKTIVNKVNKIINPSNTGPEEPIIPQGSKESLTEGPIKDKINSLLNKLNIADPLLSSVFSTLPMLILAIFKVSPNIIVSLWAISHVVSLFLIALYRQIKENKAKLGRNR
jgi:hypothetical protein